MKHSFLKLAALAGLSMGLLASARADSIYTIAVPNTALSVYPSPYGEVTVHLTDSTHALITFTGDVTGGFTYKFGGAGAVDVNVNGAFSAGSWSSSFWSSNSTSGAPASTGSGNISSFGNFDLTVDNFDGAGKAFTSGSFVLTAISGNSWGSSADVLDANSDGYHVGAHIFVFNSDGRNVLTGFAGDGTTKVPDAGMTAVLLGLGLVAVSFFARRRTA